MLSKIEKAIKHMVDDEIAKRKKELLSKIDKAAEPSKDGQLFASMDMNGQEIGEDVVDNFFPQPHFTYHSSHDYEDYEDGEHSYTPKYIFWLKKDLKSGVYAINYYDFEYEFYSFKIHRRGKTGRELVDSRNLDKDSFFRAYDDHVTELILLGEADATNK